jgi:uncharacterized protein (TIGR02246 family)
MGRKAMPANIEGDAREEIRHLVKSINDAWVAGHLEELESYFHQDMVIAQPGSGARGTGRQACVDSYREFTSHAIVGELKESNHHIDIWGDTAVVSYRFELDYQMSGQEHHDSGVDLFVFARKNGRWLAVWRAILPLPGEE